jgi:hypothetical protein
MSQVADLSGELLRLAIGRISDGEVEYAKKHLFICTWHLQGADPCGASNGWKFWDEEEDGGYAAKRSEDWEWYYFVDAQQY